MQRRAIIAGAGISGLATALALIQSGWSVTVLERAEALNEVGAGLQISPNGMKVLNRLGIVPAIEHSLFEPVSIEIRQGKSGRRLLRLPLKNYAEARWGARYIHIHRANLALALSDALVSAAPGSIKCGKQVETYEQDAKCVRVLTRDGSTYEADLLVGADGIHSGIRARMLGEDKPRFTGNVAWRALIPVDRFGGHPPPPTACIWLGHKRHAVTTRVRGGTVVNFVGMVERTEAEAESWTSIGDRQVALNDFRGWAPEIVTAIAQADSLNLWPLYDRPPLPRWSDGRIILVGDAAHPMLPSLAQGAVQSLEDAVALADSLDSLDTVEAAGLKFFADRIARTTRVQAESAANVRRFHQADTVYGALLYTGMAVTGTIAPTILHRRNDWLFGADIA